MFARLMGLNTVSPDELHRLITSGQVTTIDVNSRQSRNRAHVPGASNMDPVELADGDLPTDKAAKLVFYCSNSQCRKAPNTARRAKKMGYSDVGVMAAGISGRMRPSCPLNRRNRPVAGRVTVGALNSRSIPYKVGPDSGL